MNPNKNTNPHPSRLRNTALGVAATVSSMALGDVVNITDVIRDEHEAVEVAIDPFLEAQQAADSVLARYESIPDLHTDWVEHVHASDHRDRLTPWGVAAKKYNLTFIDSQKTFDKISDTYSNNYETFAGLETKEEALAFANKYAAKYGFQYAIPKSPLPLNKEGTLHATPLRDEDLSVDLLKQWIESQFDNRLNKLPKELFALAEIENYYLVKDLNIQDASAIALLEQHAVAINLGTMINETTNAPGHAFNMNDANTMEHEMAHHLADRLHRMGLLDMNLAWQLAMQPNSGKAGEHFLLSALDRPDAAVHPQEQIAAILARLLRHEPLAEDGRDGLNKSSAYVLSALDKAVQKQFPGADIAGYLMALGKYSGWRVNDASSLELSAKWQAYEEAKK